MTSCAIRTRWGWVIEQAQNHFHTYQFILSAKHVDLDEDDYTKALQAGGDLFKTWRLMRHDDSAYPHAHILAFGDKEIRIKEKEFQEWFQRVRGELEQIQDHYLEMQKEMRMEVTPVSAPKKLDFWVRKLGLIPIVVIIGLQERRESFTHVYTFNFPTETYC